MVIARRRDKKYKALTIETRDLQTRLIYLNSGQLFSQLVTWKELGMLTSDVVVAVKSLLEVISLFCIYALLLPNQGAPS